MLSTVIVRRLTGHMVQNEETGTETAEWAAVYEGPFRLDGGSSGDGGSRTVTIGGVTYEQATGVGHFPHDTTDLTDGDLVDVTAGEWQGAVFSIIEAVRADQKTARRVPIREAQRPVEWG
jgi:hypothetical protein